MIPETNGTVIEVRGEADVFPVIAWDDEGRPLIPCGHGLAAADGVFGADQVWEVVSRVERADRAEAIVQLIPSTDTSTEEVAWALCADGSVRALHLDGLRDRAADSAGEHLRLDRFGPS